MTATETVRAVNISTVWRALGGGQLRGRRGQAWWRGGDGWNVSLDDRGGVWYDHREGTGGGVLDLIQHVRGCTRREALLWLSDLLGLALDNPPLSRAVQERYQDAHREAPVLAHAAALWWAERREFLEWAKAEASRRDDLSYLAVVAREHFCLGDMSPDGIVQGYLYAQQRDPDGTAALVAAGERWTLWAEAAAVLVTARLARDAGVAP